MEAKDHEEHILIVGGAKTGLCQHENIAFLDKEPEDGILTQVPIYAAASHSSVCTDKDSFIFSGGFGYTSPRRSISRVQKYTISSCTWEDLPDLPHPVHWHGSAVLDARLFSIGGRCQENDQTQTRYSTVNVLNPASPTWSECQHLPSEVDDPGVAVIDNFIFVVGGHTGEGYSTQTCKYDTTTDKITKCKPMPDSGSVMKSTVAVNQQLFVLSRSLFLQYDVMTDQWSELPLPLKPSHNPAMVVNGGRLLAMGGHEEDHMKPCDTIQSFDVSSKTWNLDKRRMPLKLTYLWAFVMKVPQRK